jgi:hypothetical protein
LDGAFEIFDLLKKQKMGNTGKILKVELIGHDVAVYKLTRE